MARREWIDGMRAYVYVCASAVHADLLKIGSTRDLAKRASGLQVGSPVRLAYLAAWETSSPSDARSLETRLHRLLYSRRRHGEWFSCSLPDVEAAVKELCSRRRLEETPISSSRVSSFALSKCQYVGRYFSTQEAVAERKSKRQPARPSEKALQAMRDSTSSKRQNP